MLIGTLVSLRKQILIPQDVIEGHERASWSGCARLALKKLILCVRPSLLGNPVPILIHYLFDP